MNYLTPGACVCKWVNLCKVKGGGVEKIACVKKHGYADSTDLPNTYRISTRFLHNLFMNIWKSEQLTDWRTGQNIIPLSTLCVGCFYEF